MPHKDPEKRRECNRRHYARHSDKVKAAVKEYKNKNPNSVKDSYIDRCLTDPEGIILSNAKSRAKKKGLDFNITREDLVCPEFCPLLGIPLMPTKGTGLHATDNSPSVDRLDPAKGYIKGNVWIISYRANTIKNSATWQELFSLALNLRAKIVEVEEEEKKNAKKA
jgi:hypothetical protein